MTNSPLNFLPFGFKGALGFAKGLADKDLKGQGFGARLKNAAATGMNTQFNTDFDTQNSLAEDQSVEGLHGKLDKLLSLSGSENPTGQEETVVNNPNPQPQMDPSALKMKANAFMGTPQQSPHSNGTGGKNPTFKENDALRMMAVADPDTKTSGLLFTGPPYGEKGITVNPTIKVKGEDYQGYQKANVGVETNPVKVSPSAKLSAGVGVDSKSKKGYQSLSPSAKVKLKLDIGKLWKKKEEKKKEIKHDW